MFPLGSVLGSRPVSTSVAEGFLLQGSMDYEASGMNQAQETLWSPHHTSPIPTPFPLLGCS